MYLNLIFFLCSVGEQNCPVCYGAEKIGCAIKEILYGVAACELGLACIIFC